MKTFDISLPLSPRLPTWPGNPPFELEPRQRMASGASANVSRLVLGTHSGTHVDAPRHFFDGRAGVDELPLDELVGSCRVVEIDVPPGRHPIGVSEIQRGAGGPPPRRLLLKTANSRLWNGAPFTSEFIYVTPEAAEWLVASGVRLVGVDYLSIEEFRKPGAPAHRTLLGAGVVIVEGLNLANVPPGPYELICLPLRIEGSDGSPARVILRQA
jgi:arylformamidase